MKRIGFARKYYTLWNIEEEVIQSQDAYGKYWPTMRYTRYFYVQNISMDIKKVKLKYPDVSIDESLRGQTQDFVKTQKLSLPPEYFNFGKHQGKLLSDVYESNYDYLIWYYRNAATEPQRIIMEKFPKISMMLDEEVKAVEARKASNNAFTSGKHKLALPHNAYSTAEDDWRGKGMVEFHPTEFHNLRLFFADIRPMYYQGYTYFLPVSNGKCIRIKNIMLEYELEILDTIHSADGFLWQNAQVKSITKI